MQKERSDEQIDVVFEIKEFDKVQIKKITFLGNKAFDDYKLKSLMETKSKAFFLSSQVPETLKSLTFKQTLKD